MATEIVNQEMVSVNRARSLSFQLKKPEGLADGLRSQDGIVVALLALSEGVRVSFGEWLPGAAAQAETFPLPEGVGEGREGVENHGAGLRRPRQEGRMVWTSRGSSDSAQSFPFHQNRFLQHLH